eukprot:3081866-Rhodomonas_salina.2
MELARARDEHESIHRSVDLDVVFREFCRGRNHRDSEMARGATERDINGPLVTCQPLCPRDGSEQVDSKPQTTETDEIVLHRLPGLDQEDMMYDKSLGPIRKDADMTYEAEFGDHAFSIQIHEVPHPCFFLSAIWN